MSIDTLAQYHAAAKQAIFFHKTAGGSSSTYPIWCSASFFQGGTPGVASLSIGNTANGLVPDDTLTGAPNIEPFSGTGYVTAVEFSAAIETRIVLYDRLFHAGTFAGTVGVNSLTSQPSFSSRVPGGTDYKGLQIWLEQAVGGGGANNAANSMRVQYTNQDGTTGRVSGTVFKNNNVTGVCIRVPLQEGDSGVQAIENFEVVAASSNAQYNVFVARPLWTGRVQRKAVASRHWLDLTSMPQVWADSCLCTMQMFDSGSAPQFALDIEIASN